MFPILQMSAGAWRLLARQQLTRASRKQLSSDHHGVPESYKHLVTPSMTASYPVPNQLYSDAYNARQAKYNKLLILSTLFFLSAVGSIYANGTFEFLEAPPRKVNI